LIVIRVRIRRRIGRLRLCVCIVAARFRSLLHCEAEGTGCLCCRCDLCWIVCIELPAHIRSSAAAEGLIVIMISDERRCCCCCCCCSIALELPNRCRHSGSGCRRASAGLRESFAPAPKVAVVVVSRAAAYILLAESACEGVGARHAWLPSLKPAAVARASCGKLIRRLHAHRTQDERLERAQPGSAAPPLSQPPLATSRMTTLLTPRRHTAAPAGFTSALPDVRDMSSASPLEAAAAAVPAATAAAGHCCHTAATRATDRKDDNSRQAATRAAHCDANKAKQKRALVAAKTLRAATAGATAALTGEVATWGVERLVDFRFSAAELQFATQMQVPPRPDLFRVVWSGPYKASWQDVHYLGGYHDAMVSQYLHLHAKAVRAQQQDLFGQQSQQQQQQQQVTPQDVAHANAPKPPKSAARKAGPSSVASRKRKRQATESTRRERPVRAAAAAVAGCRSSAEVSADAEVEGSGTRDSQMTEELAEQQQPRSSSQLTALTIVLQQQQQQQQPQKQPQQQPAGRARSVSRSVSTPAVMCRSRA